MLQAVAGLRRTWTLEQKLGMVAQMENCDNIAAFAREHDIRTLLLYNCRRELRYALEATPPVEHEAGPAFIPVVATSRWADLRVPSAMIAPALEQSASNVCHHAIRSPERGL